MLNIFCRPNLNYAPFVLPLILLPLLAEWLYQIYDPVAFMQIREEFFIANLVFVVIVRLAILDVMLFLFSRSSHALHVALMRVVGLYLEITVVTIAYFAIMFYIFGLFDLFQYNANIAAVHLENIEQHKLISAFYISTVSFTTLGLGDWVPQTLNAMIAVSVEVILGIMQTAIFMAIIIYAHQNRKILAR